MITRSSKVNSIDTKGIDHVRWQMLDAERTFVYRAMNQDRFDEEEIYKAQSDLSKAYLTFMNHPRNCVIRNQMKR